MLVLDAAALSDKTKAAPLTLPTGPGARLATRPLVRFGPDHLASTPELIKRGSIQLLRHLLDGRLPNGERARPGTDLARALDRLRQARTGEGFERSVRSDLGDAGFVTGEIPARGPITAQIDAVAADCVAQQLWVISVKDPLFPFRPQQAMEQLDRFFADYLPQLDRNLAEVEANREHVWQLLRKTPNGQGLPSSDPGWPTTPALICRDTLPVVAVRRSPRSMPAVILRRHIPDWRPGDPPPPALNPPVSSVD